MASAPQASPVSFVSSPHDKHSGQNSRSQSAVAISSQRVLLVGRNGSWGSAVLKSVEKNCSDILFVTPQEATPEFVRKGAHNLILLDSTVLPEQRKSLTAELIGTPASVFYTFPVENGCWWLPALLHGEDCHGAPAFRRNEFPVELDRLLQEASDA